MKFVNPKREYVVVCNRHNSLIRNTLLFWGGGESLRLIKMRLVLAHKVAV